MEQKKELHKGVLGILLGILLCVSLLPVTVFAEVNAQTQEGELFIEEQALSEQNLVPSQDEEQIAIENAAPEQNTALATTLDVQSEQITAQTNDSEDLIISSMSLNSALPEEPTESTSITPAAGEVAKENAVAQVDANGESKYYATIEEAFAEANNSTSATITLLKDCKAAVSSSSSSDLTVDQNNTITLDLNGCTLTGNGQTSVLHVNGNLILNDSSGTNKGTITGGKGDYPTGAVGAYNGYGGGICLASNSSTFIMNGGTITGNSASRGGGVYVASKSSFTMTGGTITNNNADQGGGIYAYTSLTINGGTISGNTAEEAGGGIYTINCSLNVNGGTITKNHANQMAGGIFATNITVSDSPVVSGNTIGVTGNQIEGNLAITLPSLASTNRLTLGKLTEGAKIGVSVYAQRQDVSGTYDYVEPTADTPVRFTMEETDTSYYADSAQYFFSDRKGYIAQANDRKYLELAVGYTVTFETNGGSAIDAVTGKPDSTINLSDYVPAREGYDFTGWYSDAALTNKVESVTLNEDMTVYAGWEENATPPLPSDDLIDQNEPGGEPADEPNDSEATNDQSEEGSDEGTNIPLTGNSLQMGLVLLSLCALASALGALLVFTRQRERGKHSA